MVRGRTASVLVRKWDGWSERRVPDELAVEEPLEVRLDGNLVTTTMRTPGHDFELAAGFCFTEGLLAGEPVTGVRYCATGSAVDTGFNVVTVETAGRAPVPAARLTTTTSSCGICGTAGLDQLRQRLSPLTDLATFDLDVLAKVSDQVRGAQTLFAATGGVHAASAFDPSGTPVIVREDVGRHNALDKVIGALARAGRDPAEGFVVVTSRASYELVQKAAVAGVRLLAAVSLPTGLAIRLAEASGLTLVALLRGGTANVYAHGERLGL
jgi:FdhD protein